MSRRSRALFSARGFTLLEVMIALAILALSAAAVMRQAQLGVRQQQQLELRSAALWVADDGIALLLGLDAPPPLGRAERAVESRGQNWTVTTDVSDAPGGVLRKITVSVNVADRGENEPPLVSLTTFRGRY